MGFFCGKRMEKMLKAYEGGEIGAYLINGTVTEAEGTTVLLSTDRDFDKIRAAYAVGTPVYVQFNANNADMRAQLVSIAEGSPDGAEAFFMGFGEPNFMVTITESSEFALLAVV